ncbi:MAG: hypothetical protein A2075_12235 [Geobacteraceae bacterium GWC2_58_44]|nr:MAG: hypothetical protein A2075_12235 [Geobacteraceae bacterium GWC2_58_44]HBG06331.1 peptidase P60 [Geobacter sp.]
MKTATLASIRDHALRDLPNEACGFILNADGNEKVFPVRNMHDKPAESFAVHPGDYLEAKRAGTLLALYHSHPAGPAAATRIDTLACNRSGLVWYVYSVPDETVSKIVPAGRAPLHGRPFVWGVYDCWTLVYDYYQEKLGITLPDWEPYEEDFWEKGKNYYVERYAQFGFVPVQDLRCHDVLLMQLGGRVKMPIHSGIYQSNGTLLHHVPGRLSTSDVYGDYLRSMTNLVLRHGSLL